MGARIELSPYYYAVLSDEPNGKTEIFYEGLEIEDVSVGEISRWAAEEWSKSAQDARALMLLHRPKKPKVTAKCITAPKGY